MLDEVHKKRLEEKFVDHPSALLDQAMESLTSQLSNLKVTKTTVYNLMEDQCALSFKKAHFHSKERNTPDNILKDKIGLLDRIRQVWTIIATVSSSMSQLFISI